MVLLHLKSNVFTEKTEDVSGKKVISVKRGIIMQNFVLNLSNEGVTLTCYIPDYSEKIAYSESRPAMLVLPGGAYRFCSEREGEPIAFDFLAKGFAAFVLRYSVEEKSKFPAPLDDAQEALKIIRENAGKWHINPHAVAAAGFSAGGHLCAALASMADEKPDAAVLIYPCILSDIGSAVPFEIPDITRYVDGSTVPCFIASSREDGVVPIKHSLRLADKLDEHGVPFEMHIFSSGYHGFADASKTAFSQKSDYEYNRHAAVWVDLCETWLEKTLGI